MTNFELQTSLTTQIMEFTSETRTAVVVAAYRDARVAGVDTTTEMTIPVLLSMLQEQIELFAEENPELFGSELEAEECDDERRERAAEYIRSNGSVFERA